MADRITVIPKKIVTVIEPHKSTLVDREKYRQTRVAAYCRVSTDSEEQLTSYKTQKKVYTDMIAARKDWSIVDIYADEGISGTLAEKRPRFKKMIEDCLAGKIDYFVTKSVSRFARNTVECLDYVRMLKSRGIGILFEEQNIDTLKSDSELYLVIYAGFAQAESESISKNITWSKRKNFEEGKVSLQYKKMLGYRKGEDGEPEIVPEEAKLVERIFDLYIAGETPLSISEMLQAENPTFDGKYFTYGKGMIEGILFNVKYCGDAILQQSVTVDPIMKKRKKNTGEALMYYVQNSHPAIVTREKFNKAQEERARRRTFAPKSQKAAITATGKYSRYALSQVLICVECGSPYKRVHWNIRGKKSIVWRCVNRLDHGTQYCKESPTLREDKLKEAVVRAIRQFNEQDANTYTTLMKATIAEAIGFDGSDDEKELLERQVNGLNEKMIAIVNESIVSGEDIESREAEIKEIADTIENLKRRIQIITENSMKNAEYADRIAEIERIITERASHQNEYDDSIVRQMVECIKVYADKHIEVIFGGGYAVEETVEYSSFCSAVIVASKASRCRAM